MTDTKIAPKSGETWVRRDGGLARIYAVDCSDTYPIHGATKSDGQWFVNVWTSDGHYSVSEKTAAYDLIHKYDWRIELAPIWAVLKPEYRWVAMDFMGEWFAYESEPHINIFEDVLCSADGTREELLSSRAFTLPHPDCPWYETLTERPEVQD